MGMGLQELEDGFAAVAGSEHRRAGPHNVQEVRHARIMEVVKDLHVIADRRLEVATQRVAERRQRECSIAILAHHTDAGENAKHAQERGRIEPELGGEHAGILRSRCQLVGEIELGGEIDGARRDESHEQADHFLRSGDTVGVHRAPLSMVHNARFGTTLASFAQEKLRARRRGDAGSLGL